jgi:Uri superfamily endonuclease
VTFPAGWYAYAGSAHGPGGIAARVRRHLRAAKRLHWHIDYLRAVANPVEVWYATDPERWECRWAEALSTLPGVSTPASGFGASDCCCVTHLFRLPALPDPDRFATQIVPTPARHRVVKG